MYQRSVVILEKYFDEDIVKLASHHHERLNNSGYPEHLNAKKLSLLAEKLEKAAKEKNKETRKEERNTTKFA